MEPVEDMRRCIDLNHSVAGFWRDWHHSYYRWLMRYVYLPLGGNMAGSAYTRPAAIAARRLLNVIVVFSWVAFWHDRSLKLLAWASLISIIFIPEMLAARVAASYSALTASPHYRHLKAAAASINIVFLLAVNLLGFGLGIRSTLRTLIRLFESGVTLLVVMLCLFSAVQIQLEVGRWEAWRETQRKQIALVTVAQWAPRLL